MDEVERMWSRKVELKNQERGESESRKAKIWKLEESYVRKCGEKQREKLNMECKERKNNEKFKRKRVKKYRMKLA